MLHGAAKSSTPVRTRLRGCRTSPIREGEASGTSHDIEHGRC